MGIPDDTVGLQFACECVSAADGYGDPWAPVAHNKLLPDGTKEKILNLVAREPRTIAQLADELGLSQPSVHTHVTDMLASELLREPEQWKKHYPAERYYEPNFPVIAARERTEFDALCGELAERIAELFEKRRPKLEGAFGRTGLGAKDWTFDDITQYLFAKAQRGARERLEERGVLPTRQRHRNGVEWIFWA
jgi:DNA-binding transcriptional ArsR family regulator